MEMSKQDQRPFQTFIQKLESNSKICPWKGHPILDYALFPNCKDCRISGSNDSSAG